MNIIVSKQWVLARMYETDVVIVDCRFDMTSPEAGHASYNESHVPGAVYLDLEQDLSAPVDTHGGRHPLPDPSELAAKFSRAGISNQSRVIAYDDQGGMIAARLWWLLRWLGHDDVFVMDEGFTAWKDGGYPVTDNQRVIVPATFTVNIQSNMLADVHEVRDSIENNQVILVDSRESKRYLGIEEPIHKRAGHIPGAINRFWKNLKDKRGFWKSEPEIRAELAPVTEAMDQGKVVIMYCGSGVSATPNVLALHLLGYKQAKLYAGSWSDWISYEHNPVATGEEK